MALKGLPNKKKRFEENYGVKKKMKIWNDCVEIYKEGNFTDNIRKQEIVSDQNKIFIKILGIFLFLLKKKIFYLIPSGDMNM